MAEKRSMEQLLEEINFLRSGQPFHVHTNGLLCRSPYCHSLELKEPIGAPPDYKPAPEYGRS